MRCIQTCTTASDCGNGTAAYDADNYACEDGTCVYTGCNTDAECEHVSVGWVCRRAAVPLTDPPLLSASMNCVQPCKTHLHCRGTEAFDADNYACTDGVCRYVGCNADDECAASFGSDRYVCR